jgi:hypothetical protein
MLLQHLNKTKCKAILLCCLLLSVVSNSFATTKYWIGTGSAVWGNGANWSLSSGGAGGTPAPGSSDIGVFDNHSGNCNINTAASPGTLSVTSGYTGTITQNAGVTIGSGGASLSGGTFTGYSGGGSNNISCSANFTVSGMAFTSTVNTLTIVGNFSFSSGSFSHNNGLVVFNTTNSLTGSTTFYDLTFATLGGTTPTFTISGGTVLTVNHLLKLNTTNAITINTGDIEAKGDITILNTASGGGGSATIKINGTGTQTLTGSGVANTGNLCKVEVNKSSGTLYLTSIITLANDWNYVTGTVNAEIYGSTVDASASLNLDGQGSGGTMELYNLTIYGGTTTLTGNIGIKGDMTINSSQTLSAGSNTLSLSGQWVNNGTFTYSTSTIEFVGSYLQTVNTSSSTETFYNLTMNKADRLLLNDPVIVNNNVTFTAGIIKASSSNYFKLINNATASGGNDTSFVYGYYKKVGDDAFTYALGDTSVSTGGYHPLSMGAPSSTSDAYTAQYFNTIQTLGTARDIILNYTSTCEYWKLDRDVGSSSVTVKLAWNTTSCNIDSLIDLRVAFWDGSKWADKGGSYTGNTSIGDVISSSAQSSFGYFLIAKKFPNANAGADVGICPGGSTNLVGSLGTSYLWTPSTSLSCTNCYNPTANPSSTITYVYRVTYYSGYQSTDTVIVTVFGSPIALAGPDKRVYLGGGIVIGASPAASGGSSPYTYSWSPSTALSSTTVANPIASPTGSITYTLTVTDNHGCVSAGDAMVVSVDTARHYAIPKKKLDGGYYTTRYDNPVSFLYLEFDEEYDDTGNLDYKIYKGDNTVIAGLPSKTVAIGHNQYELALNVSKVQLGAFYILEITNEKQEKWFLRFYANP